MTADKNGAQLLQEHVNELRQVIDVDLYGFMNDSFGHRFRFLHCMQELYCRLDNLKHTYNFILRAPYAWCDEWATTCQDCINQIEEIIGDLEGSKIRMGNEMYDCLHDESDISLLGDVEPSLRKIDKQVAKLKPEQYDELIVLVLRAHIEYLKMMCNEVAEIRNGTVNICSDSRQQLQMALREFTQRVNEDCAEEYSAEMAQIKLRSHNLQANLTDRDLENFIRTRENQLLDEIDTFPAYKKLFYEFTKQMGQEEQLFPDAFPLFVKLYQRTDWEAFLTTALKYLYYYGKHQNLIDGTPVSPKKTRTRVKGNPSARPEVFSVYKLKGTTTPGHIKMLYAMLVGQNWITNDCEGDFLKLFSGESCKCVIGWTGKVGVGSLKALIARMIEESIIEEVTEYISIIEHHFVDENNHFLSNVKGGSVSNKNADIIESYIRMLKCSFDELQANLRNEDYNAPSDRNEIQEGFNDNENVVNSELY